MSTVTSKPTSISPSSRAHTHIPELDGLRGIAILLVILFHALIYDNQRGLAGAVHILQGIGWSGVDLFFALSGFLITGILLDAPSGTGQLRRFYLRRCLRILPLYYLAVIAWFWVMPAIGRTSPAPTEQLWYWFHVSNWRTAFQPLVYPPVTHFWSLAIEEQFYLLWPLVVVRCSRRTALWTAIALIVASVALRNLPGVQHTGQAFPNYMYRLTPFRIDTLLVGAVAAFVYRDANLRQIAIRWINWLVLGAAAVVAVVLSVAGTSPHSEAMTRFGYSGFALFFGGVVLYAGLNSGASTWVQRFLRCAPLRGFGKYSYCLYVIHGWFPAPRGYAHRILGSGPIAAMGAIVAEVGVLYLLAMASWYGIERHFLRLQSYYRT